MGDSEETTNPTPSASSTSLDAILQDDWDVDPDVFLPSATSGNDSLGE
jgi:hypothetical protein